MAAMVVGSAAGGLWPPWGLAAFLVVPLLIAALECSVCETAVRADATRCRHCGADLVDTIETRNDRFEAEERWRKAQGAEETPDEAQG